MLRNSQRLQKWNNWLIFVIAEKGELTLTQLNVQLIIHVGWIDLSWGHLLIWQFIVATEAKLDDANQLSLLFEGKIAILKDFTLAKGDSHEGRMLLRVEKVVWYILEF